MVAIAIQKNTMPSQIETPLEIVRQVMKDMERGDYASAWKHPSDNCQYTDPPPLGSVCGQAAMRAVLEPFFAPALENEFKGNL